MRSVFFNLRPGDSFVGREEEGGGWILPKISIVMDHVWNK